MAFESYRLTDVQTDTLRVVTSGHVTKMAVTPFDPPYSKSKPGSPIFYRTTVMDDRRIDIF